MKLTTTIPTNIPSNGTTPLAGELKFEITGNRRDIKVTSTSPGPNGTPSVITYTVDAGELLKLAEHIQLAQS
jgi:hypothetical protein